MKIKLLIMHGLAFVMALQWANSQSLSEKLYSFSIDGDPIMTSVENIPDSIGAGQILVSSVVAPSAMGKTAIMRVDNDGDVIWETEYTHTGSGTVNFGQGAFMKGHRIGFNPDNNRTIIVGESIHSTLRPTFIEVNTTNGNVMNEYYYEEDYYTNGYLSAIHTVMDGPHEGAYMVGAVLASDLWVPMLTKVGGTTDFQKIYDYTELTSETEFYYYEDVDVDHTDGYVVAVGYKTENYADYVTGIVDVFETDGTYYASYEYELATGEEDRGRFSAVKCVAPGRVVIGGMRNNKAFVMQINIETGNIHWSRYVDYADEGSLEEVIEVEQDAEGSPIIMAVSEHAEGGVPAEGPGIVARLEPNGMVDWAITEDMPIGYGDIEPQYTSDDFITMLVNIEGYENKLTYLNNTNGFYSCQTETQIYTNSDPEVNKSNVSRAILNIDNYTSTTPTYTSMTIDDEDGCCWLPYFNPVPWNHPWETTYYDDDPAVVDLTGLYTGYTYDWHILYTRDVRNWQITTAATALSVSGTNDEVGTFDFVWNNNPEKSRYYVIATDPSGCKGRDDGALTMSDDGGDIPRPDYTNTTHGANLEHHNYFHCVQSAGPPYVYLYQHKGDLLDSDGYNSGFGYPNIINGSPNYLSSTAVNIFEEDVKDYFQAGTPRIVTVDTDVKVDPCSPSCAPTLSTLKWTAESGRRMYSIESDNLDNNPSIVKYAFSLHLDDGSTEEHEMVKRYKMVIRSSSSSIVPDDFLIPMLDERYMDSYPAYSTTSSNKLYLDIWFTSDGSYPYDIDCHKRYEIVLDPGEVNRLAPVDEHDETMPIASASPLGVFPNPAKGVFELRGLSGPADIEVYDMEGRLVVEQSVKGVAGGNQRIDLRQEPAGLYVMRAQLADGITVMHKLMKE